MVIDPCEGSPGPMNVKGQKKFRLLAEETPGFFVNNKHTATGISSQKATFARHKKSKLKFKNC
jgi:hypothetical protein